MSITSKSEIENRMNMSVTNKGGYTARILNYHSSYNIDLIFEDGTILYKRQYQSFKKGGFLHPEEIKSKDLTGRRFGKITVICDSGLKSRSRERMWKCKCDCGNVLNIRTGNLVRGDTKSCGCSRYDNRAKMSDKDAAISRIIQNYKHNAKTRGVEWALSYEEVVSIIQKPCYYCGANNSNYTKAKECHDTGIYHSGIDRVDSNLGYTLENVVPCCTICNYAKNDLSKEEFYEWILRVSSHLKDKIKN